MTPHGKLEKDAYGRFVASLWVKLEEDAGKDTTPESYLDRMQAVLTALLR